MKDGAPPSQPEASVRNGKCSACRRAIPAANDMRCPYVSCRKWFRGAEDLATTKRKKAK